MITVNAHSTNQDLFLPAVTQARLKGYAGILKKMADSYMGTDYLKGRDETGLSREALLYIYREDKNRVLIQKMIYDISGQISKLADMEFDETEKSKKQKRKIVRELKSGGINVKDYYRKKNINGHIEIGMTLNSRQDYFAVSEVTDLLSMVLHCNMINLTDGYTYIHEKEISFVFEEEPNYQMISSFAKATKELEEVSGDNYLMRDFGDGTYICALSDGMGSGKEACSQSERILYLLEKSIENGIQAEMFAGFINRFFYMQKEEEQSATLDILRLNEYTGEVCLYKYGAAPTFLVHKNKIRIFPAPGPALGLEGEVGQEEIRFFVYEKDKLIMVSDGVMDCFDTPEGSFTELLLENREKGAGDMAAAILEKAIYKNLGKIEDDLTVLVMEVNLI